MVMPTSFSHRYPSGTQGCWLCPIRPEIKKIKVFLITVKRTSSFTQCCALTLTAMGTFPFFFLQPQPRPAKGCIPGQMVPWKDLELPGDAENKEGWEQAACQETHQTFWLCSGIGHVQCHCIYSNSFLSNALPSKEAPFL